MFWMNPLQRLSRTFRTWVPLVYTRDQTSPLDHDTPTVVLFGPHGMMCLAGIRTLQDVCTQRPICIFIDPKCYPMYMCHWLVQQMLRPLRLWYRPFLHADITTVMRKRASHIFVFAGGFWDMNLNDASHTCVFTHLFGYWVKMCARHEYRLVCEWSAGGSRFFPRQRLPAAWRRRAARWSLPLSCLVPMGRGFTWFPHHTRLTNAFVEAREGETVPSLLARFQDELDAHPATRSVTVLDPHVSQSDTQVFGRSITRVQMACVRCMTFLVLVYTVAVSWPRQVFMAWVARWAGG